MVMFLDPKIRLWARKNRYKLPIDRHGRLLLVVLSFKILGRTGILVAPLAEDNQTLGVHWSTHIQDRSSDQCSMLNEYGDNIENTCFIMFVIFAGFAVVRSGVSRGLDMNCVRLPLPWSCS